jgi:hypothetical protein
MTVRDHVQIRIQFSSLEGLAGQQYISIAFLGRKTERLASTCSSKATNKYEIA